MAGRESELLATVAQLTESNNQLLNRVKQSDEECGSLKHANTELEKTKEILAQIETKFTDLGKLTTIFLNINSNFRLI